MIKCVLKSLTTIGIYVTVRPLLWLGAKWDNMTYDGKE